MKKHTPARAAKSLELSTETIRRLRHLGELGAVAGGSIFRTASCTIKGGIAGCCDSNAA